jgi:hypothetical protein
MSSEEQFTSESEQWERVETHLVVATLLIGVVLTLFLFWILSGYRS